MLISLCEIEKKNKIHDCISEYCKVEQLNEEYFRCSIIKNRLGGKRLRERIIIAICHWIDFLHMEV